METSLIQSRKKFETGLILVWSMFETGLKQVGNQFTNIQKAVLSIMETSYKWLKLGQKKSKTCLKPITNLLGTVL